MERISIQELSAILVTKSGLKKKDAERFSTTIFEVIKDGLKNDRLVKIKGFGTFKVINIESRESINVNTGERVVIEGHEKVTFTPDGTMKELVNKPFSLFETVILNEGVTFDDISLRDLELEATQESDVLLVQEPDVPPVQESVAEQESVIVEPRESLTVELSKETEIVDKEELEEPEKDSEEEIKEEAEEDEEMSKKYKNVFWTIATVAVIASFFIGYFVGRMTAPQPVVEAKKADSSVVSSVDMLNTDTMSLKNDTATAVIAESSVKSDSSDKAEPSVMEEVAKKEPEEKKEPAAVEAPAVDSKKYEQADARVRTGAYRIVGTSREITVQPGENIYRITACYLGHGMECYIEAYNGLKPGSTLKAGQTLKIPKLEVKKKTKKNKNKD